VRLWRECVPGMRTSEHGRRSNDHRYLWICMVVHDCRHRGAVDEKIEEDNI
jgi:hypothetical protein